LSQREADNAAGTTTDIEQFVASLPFGGAPPPEPRPSRDKIPKEPKHEYVAGEMIAGKYQLSRLLGEGGMGAVWLARNQALDADVAVKLIRRERATPGAAQRLLQEARAAARLGHPSIVRVFDFGESEYRDPFIVMEVLNGESLRDLLERRKQLRPSRAVRTLLPIASALAAAHSKGIVHRDLKPDNILLVAEAGVTVPKIVDFGIAKLRQDEIATPFTQTGQIMGSPGYMSPEQLDGRADIDQRADVWSFAVVLYEALTGTRPFEGNHYSAMLSAILLKDPVPITEHGVGDEALWSIVARGLEKIVDQRWASMGDMGTALARWGLERGIENDITGISLAAYWLHGGDGPASDAPPSAPYAAYLAEDGGHSILPKPRGVTTPGPEPPTRLLDPPTPEPTTAESPSFMPPAPFRGSRPVLIGDPTSVGRRVLERPLMLLAIGAFCLGIVGTWVSRAFVATSPNAGANPPDPLETAPSTAPAELPAPPGAPSPGNIDPPDVLDTAAPQASSTTGPGGSGKVHIKPGSTATVTPPKPGASGQPGSQPGSQPGKKTPGGSNTAPAKTAMPLPKLPNF
jgi:serine/threonine-protein kinase